MEPRELSANLEARRQRSAAIREAIARLAEQPRVRPDDRARLAANLGAMVEQRLGDASPQRLRVLFTEAFGEAAGDTNYRKRKRFVRLAGEATDTPEAQGELNAHGEAFVQLADAIARLDTDRLPAEDQRLRAHAGLISGTSFDVDRRRMVRDAARLGDLLELFDKLVARVGAGTDLDSLRALVKRVPLRMHPLWPEKGKILAPVQSSLPIARRASGLSPEQEALVAGMADAHEQALFDHAPFGKPADLIDLEPFATSNWWSAAIPSVPLATCWVRQPEDLGRGIVEVRRSEVERLGEAVAVEIAIARSLGMELNDSWTTDSRIWACRDADPPWFKGDFLSFPPVAHVDPRGVPDLWMQYDLHLELRFDASAATWRLCVSVFPRQMKLGAWEGEPYLCLGHAPDARTVARQVSLDTEFAWAPVEGGETDGGFLVHVAAYGIYLGTLYEMIEEGELETDWPTLNGKVAGSLSLATPEGLDWILTTRESRDARLVRRLPGAGGFVPLAPAGSLAAMILDNLATAEGEERLDRMLINAVEFRLKAFRALDQTTVEVFRKQLRWLDG